MAAKESFTIRIAPFAFQQFDVPEVLLLGWRCPDQCPSQGKPDSPPLQRPLTLPKETVRLQQD